MKLCLDMVNEPVVNWVKGSLTNVGDAVVGVCYRPPHQDLVVDEAFFRKLGQFSHLPALVLMGSLNHPNICWRHNTAVLHKQYRRVWECSDDNFPTRVIKDPTGRGHSDRSDSYNKKN